MNSETIARLKQAAGAKGFSEDPKEIAPHLEEWRGKYQGRSTLLMKPATVADVSAILTICNETKTALVPQGGNTGLVGGQIAFNGEVILSTSRLNKIRAVDDASQTLIAEAGVPLAQIQKAAAEKNLLFPLSLASEGSCTIGGNLSTNAGGVAVLRYGMTRDLTLGLEVVLADGRVLNLLHSLRKDNTGYDLKQIFIGAEGTLGVITAAALKLFPMPVERATAFIAVKDAASAITLLNRLQSATSGMMSAFELIPRAGMELLLKHIPGSIDPMSAPSPWYVLAEAGSGHGVRAELEDGLSSAINDGIASDAVIAESETQRASLWGLRENLSEAQKREAPSIKHDISVPIIAIPEFIARATATVLKLAPGARPITFGHLGDGNLHFNFLGPSGDKSFVERWEEIQHVVHEMVHEFGGSISAEHGIGVQKRESMARYKSAAELDVMRMLKKGFDPSGILNPGKLLP